MRKVFVLPIVLAMVLSSINMVEAAPQSTNKGTVSVSTSATKEVDPDMAEITLAVETTAKNADIASKDNKKLMNDIIEAIKPKVDEKNGDTIKTSNYNVRPEYTYSKDGKRTLQGYTVVNSLKINTKNVAHVGELVDLAILKGANRMDSVSFGFVSTSNLCNDLYPQLVKDAQGQASIIARALNQNVKGIKNISTSCSTQYSSNLRYSAKMASPDAAGGVQEASTPIEPGKVKIYANVNAEFNVE